jgi:TRAP-type C4-dicarboxylate transport system permease small subunit
MPSAAPAAMRRLLAAWHRVECWLAACAFAFIPLVLIGDLAGRVLIGRLLTALGMRAGGTGIFGAAKLAVYALVIGTCAGIGIASVGSAHLLPRIAWRTLPRRWGDVPDRLADVLTALLLAAAAWYGALMVQGSYAIGVLAPMLGWPVWPVQLALPLGFASAALRYGCFALWPDLRARRPD